MSGQTGVIVAYVLSIALLWVYAIVVLVAGQSVSRRLENGGLK